MLNWAERDGEGQRQMDRDTEWNKNRLSCEDSLGRSVSGVEVGGALEDQPWREWRKWPCKGLSLRGCVVCPSPPHSQRGHARAFEVSDRPAGQPPNRCRWTFRPLAESYYLFMSIDVYFFQKEAQGETFLSCASHSQQSERILYKIALSS